MLSCRQKKAVRLLLRMPNDEVAAAVGVQPRTIARWLTNQEFSRAVAVEDAAVRNAASRITAMAALSAACNLLEATATTRDAKIQLDILKAADAFTAKAIILPPSMEEILREMEDGDDEEWEDDAQWQYQPRSSASTGPVPVSMEAAPDPANVVSEPPAGQGGRVWQEMG